MRKVLCSERFCLLLMTKVVAQRCSVKEGVYRNFTKFTWKHLCQSLSFQRLKAAALLKRKHWHRCFPVSFAKLLRTLFLQNPSGGCFCNEICLSHRWNPSIKTKMFFFSRVFLITNSFKVVYLLSNMRLSITVGLSFCL